MTTANPKLARPKPGLPPVTQALAWLLWLWIAAMIVGALFYAPPAADFSSKYSSRILFFHVPAAWASFLAFLAAGVWSLLYLARGRSRRHDAAAAIAVELGLVFCVLATLTGSIWSRLEWGAFWNWDPRQTSIVLAMIFYAAYLVLRSAIEDDHLRARLAASYAMLGLVISPFLYFVLPRLTLSLHPQPVVNSGGAVDMEQRMLIVMLSGAVGFTALFFWMHNVALRTRLLAVRNERDA